MTNHFTFFESYYEAVEHLDAEMKAEFFDALFKYALRDELPESPSPVVNALFTMAKPNLDKSKARRSAGQAGGKQKSSKPQAKVKQTPSDKEKDKEKDKESLPEWLDKKAWSEWVQHRKELKKPLTKSTITKQLAFLEKDILIHIAIINQSIQNGWAGLFDLKREQAKPMSKQGGQMVGGFYV